MKAAVKFLKITIMSVALGVAVYSIGSPTLVFAEQAPTTEQTDTTTTAGTTTAPTAAATSKSASDCETGFLTFPAWFRGIVKVDSNNNCQLMSPTETPPGGSGPIGISNYVWRIVLNIIEIALHLIGYLAVFFIIYGGFRFLTRGDNPSEVEAARKTIMNAVIGLVISIASIALVSFIFRIFG